MEIDHIEIRYSKKNRIGLREKIKYHSPAADKNVFAGITVKRKIEISIIAVIIAVTAAYPDLRKVQDIFRPYFRFKCQRMAFPEYHVRMGAEQKFVFYAFVYKIFLLNTVTGVPRMDYADICFLVKYIFDNLLAIDFIQFKREQRKDFKIAGVKFDQCIGYKRITAERDSKHSRAHRIGSGRILILDFIDLQHYALYRIKKY